MSLPIKTSIYKVIFNSYVSLPEGKKDHPPTFPQGATLLPGAPPSWLPGPGAPVPATPAASRATSAPRCVGSRVVAPPSVTRVEDLLFWDPNTWWLIPLSKWVITPVISGLTLLIPFIDWGYNPAY